MGFYLFTSELWRNILWSEGAIIFFVIGLYILIRNFGNYVVCCFAIVLILAACGMTRPIDFSELWDAKLGAVVILEKEEPLLYNYYITIAEEMEKNKKQEESLRKECDNSIHDEAKEIYEERILAVKNRRSSLEAIMKRIEAIAQKLYFSKYLAKIDRISVDPDIERELREVEEACSKLIAE